MDPDHRTEFRTSLRRDAAAAARQKLAAEPERPAGPEPWWCDCPDRRGPHVHMPNWDGDRKYGMIITALVDVETGWEIPGSRK